MNKRNIKNLNRNWVPSSVRRMSYQKMRLYHHGLFSGFREKFGFSQRFWLSRMKKGNAFNYLDQDEVESQLKHFKTQFENQDFVKKKLGIYAKELKKDFENCVRLAKKFPQDWSRKTNGDLIRALEKYYEIDNVVSSHHWMLFNDIENILTKAIENQMFQVSHGKKKISETLSIISDPRLITPLDMEKVSLLRVALSEKKEKDLAGHHKEYAFLPVYDMDYESHPLAYFEKELVKLKRKYAKEEIKKELEKIEEKYEKRKKKSAEILKKLKKDPMIHGLLSFYAVFADLKDRKPFVRDQISHYAKELFSETAKRLNLSLTDVLFLTEKELLAMLQSTSRIQKIELTKRFEDSLFFLESGEVDIFTEKYELDFVDQMLEGEKNVDSFSGFPASPGKAKGLAAIILSNADFKKFRRGNILVASATRPDYVLLMKKAGAVITDEGGMLSHAAIVSRELNIPCVVGTKIATKVLKDGDLVEVDAKRGIVKIISQ